MADTETTALLGNSTETPNMASANPSSGPVRRRDILARAFVPAWISPFTTKKFLGAYRLKSLTSIKPMESFLAEREARPKGQSLAESLGLVDLLAYGVGATVGAGIYSLIGVAAGIAGEQPGS